MGFLLYTRSQLALYHSYSTSFPLVNQLILPRERNFSRGITFYQKASPELFGTRVKSLGIAFEEILLFPVVSHGFLHYFTRPIPYVSTVKQTIIFSVITTTVFF